MTAEIANGPIPCGRCGKDIPAFAVLYRVTPAKLPRCKACAEPLVNTLPGVELEAPTAKVSYQVPDKFTRFDRRYTAGTVRAAILDARQKQSGEKA